MSGTTLDQQKWESFLLIVFNKCQSHLQWGYFQIFQLNHNEILYSAISEWEWQDRVTRSALLVLLVKELVVFITSITGVLLLKEIKHYANIKTSEVWMDSYHCHSKVSVRTFNAKNDGKLCNRQHKTAMLIFFVNICRVKKSNLLWSC